MPCSTSCVIRVDVGRRGRAIAFADHLAADRALADERSDVDARLERRQLVEERLQRKRRTAVRSFHQRRHALPHVVLRRRHLEDAAPRVRVDVDEAGRDDEAAAVDRPSRRSVDRRRDARDRVAADRHVAAIPRAAGAVDDPRAADQRS